MATMSPLLEAPLATQIHVVAIALAVCLAPVQLFRTRRDAWHKRLGYVWVSAMGMAAISSFWISDLRHLGPFSAIHLLSIWVLYSLFRAVQAVRNGDIAVHRASLQSLATFALVGAGVFTFAPYRMMNRMIFPGSPQTGFYIALLAGAVFFGWYCARSLFVRPRPQ